MRIVLTDHELVICKATGEARNAFAVDHNYTAKGASAHWSQERLIAKHISGCETEYAASLGLNLYWRPNVGKIRDKDVGGIVEVRSTMHKDGPLRIWPTAADVDPYVLVFKENKNVFHLVGWTFAIDARVHPLVTKNGQSYYEVPQSDLMQIDLLKQHVRNVI